MADGAEKTEAPTPQKLQEARKKGNVAQSRDLTGAVGLVAATLALGFLTSASQSFVSLTRQTWADTAAGVSVATLSQALQNFAIQSLLLVAPPLAAVVLVAVVTQFLQVGPLLAGEPLKPKLEKLNPIKGLKDKFFSIKAWIEIGKTLAKFFAVGLICFLLIRSELRLILATARLEPGATASVAYSLAWRMLLFVSIAYVALAILDVLYQRWQFLKDQRMTKEEVKREFEQMEGKAEHKAERKRLHEEIALGIMFDEIEASGDVVVTNPTHIAVALRYDPKRENAPRVLGKGQGWIAERIKAIARERGIPILTNIRLARSLNELQLNTPIPPALFAAVAEILQIVEQENDRARRPVRWRPPAPAHSDLRTPPV